MKDDTDKPRELQPPNPIAALAEALNPPAGALADSLPFTLRAEIATTTPHEVQRDLFTPLNTSREK